MASKYPRLFGILRAYQSGFESLPAGTARCVVCREIRSQQDFSKEHIPPTKVKFLTGEASLPGLLTCINCNSSAGAKGQDDLKKLVQFQKWNAGNYEDSLPAEINFIDRGMTLRANITWTTGNIRMVGVPQANKKDDTQNFIDHPIEPGERWEIGGKFHYPKKAAWALVHSAYLMLVAKSEYQYAYSHAGTEIRRLLTSLDLMEVQNYCFPATELPIPGPSGIMSLHKPKDLSCYIVKVAGQFVLMPHEDDGVKLFKKWWRRSSITRLTLKPNPCRMQLTTGAKSQHLFPYVPTREKARKSLTI